ncbi:MAG: hydantoinase/oxoprolinase family protein, partial [Candidatus Tectomicrobia bacterium]|nr:hydantoinase/oxoprolinase family protein [Candidatus Tectomicrobia bacterium]
LERRFENLGLVVTAGFRHLLELGRARSAGAGRRGSHFATPLLRVPPEALVPPERVREARERVSAAGEVLQPLSPEEAAEAARWFRERNIGSVGICLLHAYANPRHELLLRDAFAREFPECFVSVSSEVIPEPGEYERAVTTLLDACIKPRIKAYLDRSAGRIEEALGEVPFLVMKSNGGVSTAREVAKKPIGTVLSGPAAGALSAAYLGRLSGHDRLITLDGGGTSTDISVIEAGETKRASRHHLDEFVLRLPMVDVVTIGTGGGSIAWRSPEGRLRVGPRSAGADPGPICYGKGGEAPTLTDANLVLARSPLHLAGGEVKLNKALAMRAMRQLAQAFNMDPLEMASGVVEIAAWNQAHAVRRATVQRGISPRDFALMAFGGSGPLTAGLVAEYLEIDTVIVPPFEGMTSAFGLEVVDLVNDHALPCLQSEEGLNLDDLGRAIERLEREAENGLALEGVPPHRRVFRRTADMRYQGEAHEIEVDLPSGYLSPPAVASALERFHLLYQRRYTYNYKGRRPVEIVQLRVNGIGLTDPPTLPLIPAGAESPEEAYKGARLVWFRELGGFADTPIYYRERLKEGNFIPGPAVVESFGSTTVVFPRQEARLDRYGNLVIRFRADVLEKKERAGRPTGWHGVGAA